MNKFYKFKRSKYQIVVNLDMISSMCFNTSTEEDYFIEIKLNSNDSVFVYYNNTKDREEDYNELIYFSNNSDIYEYELIESLKKQSKSNWIKINEDNSITILPDYIYKTN